jgi:hypothetical protein
MGCWRPYACADGCPRMPHGPHRSPNTPPSAGSGHCPGRPGSGCRGCSRTCCGTLSGSGTVCLAGTCPGRPPPNDPCSGNVGLSRRCQDQHGQADEQDNHRVLPPRSRLPAPAGDASGDGRGDNCWQCQPPMTRPKPSAESGRPSQGQTATHSCTRQYLVEDRPLWVCPAHAAFELVRRGAPYRTGRRDILGCLGRQDNGDVPKGLYSLADTSLEAGPSERSGLRRSRRPGLSAAGRRSSHHHRPSTMTTTQRRGTIG